MSTSANFLKGEFDFQAAFGTPVVPDKDLPFTGKYVDEQTEHNADYDAGTWVKSTISAKTNDYATFTLDGSAFFELIPLFLNAGINYTAAASGPVGPPQLYTYDDTLSISAEGTPRPITFRFGGNENIGGTGPAIQIADAYCQSLTISGGVNNQVAQLSSTWFGKSVDDNSAAGYAFAATGTPPLLNFVRAMGNTFELQDATTTGGDFATMTSTDCQILSWELVINTGAMPKWGADATTFNYCGVRFENPSIEFRPVIRTNATTYPLFRTAYDNRTYQEMQLTLSGDDGRLWLNQFTGRFIDVPSAHDRAEGEVVMNPVWRTERYPSQTTTPHFWSWQLDTGADITT